MKTSSCKAKGRRACAEVRELFLKHSPDDLKPDDIAVTPSGVTGEDLTMSPRARALYPYVIECKNTESIQIWAAYAQALEHWEKFKQRNPADFAVPVVFFRRNRSELMVCMRAEDFMKVTK